MADLPCGYLTDIPKTTRASVIESAVGVAATLGISALCGVPNLGLQAIAPHPVWLVVLVIAARYGTRGLGVAIPIAWGALAVMSGPGGPGHVLDTLAMPMELGALAGAVLVGWIASGNERRERGMARKTAELERRATADAATIGDLRRAALVLRARNDRLDLSLTFLRNVARRLHGPDPEAAAQAVLELITARIGARAASIEISAGTAAEGRPANRRARWSRAARCARWPWSASGTARAPIGRRCAAHRPAASPCARWSCRRAGRPTATSPRRSSIRRAWCAAWSRRAAYPAAAPAWPRFATSAVIADWAGPATLRAPARRARTKGTKTSLHAGARVGRFERQWLRRPTRAGITWRRGIAASLADLVGLGLLIGVQEPWTLAAAGGCHAAALLPIAFLRRLSGSEKSLALSFVFAMPIFGALMAVLALEHGDGDGNLISDLALAPPLASEPVAGDFGRLAAALPSCEALSAGTVEERRAIIATLVRRADADAVALLRCGRWARPIPTWRSTRRWPWKS